MVELMFKEDVDGLSSRQQEFISEILKNRGFKYTDVTIEAVGKAGDNYMANVKRITAIDIDGEIFKMVVKIAPTNEIARNRTNIDIVFKNEAIMYLEVLPKLVELQVAAGVPKEELLRFPKCYGVLLEQPNELIILEDLQLSKFVLLDRFKPLTDNIVRIILKNFAILHSLSFVWKQQDPANFTRFKTKLYDVYGAMEEDEEFSMYADNLEKDAIAVLKDEKYKMAVRNTVSKLMENCKVFEGQADSSQSVIIHGDGWTNNIMFRLQDDEPQECVLIDYQLSKVSNPTCDILYMIFNCTDHETRCKYYHEWIQYYHYELDKSLCNFGMKVESVYPKLQLDADLKKFSRIFMSLSIMLSSIILRKPEDAVYLQEAMRNGVSPEEMLESFQASNLDDESLALFRKRIEGIIDSYREFAYISDI